MKGLSVLIFAGFIVLLYQWFIRQRFPNWLSTWLDYLFLVRIPVIGGLTLISFPFIAEFIFPKFLQNLFVMESWQQLVLVMLFVTLTSVMIISLIKKIIIVENRELDSDDKFLRLRAILLIFLCLPTWRILALNYIKSWNLLFHFIIGAIAGIVLFLASLKIEKTLTDKLLEIENKLNILQKLSPRVRVAYSRVNGDNYLLSTQYNISLLQLLSRLIKYVIYVLQLLLGFAIYLGIIWLNWPKPEGQIIVSEDWQASTLLYALLIIWIVTFFVEGITFCIDKLFETQVSIFLVIFILFSVSALAHWVNNVDHYFKLIPQAQDSQIAINYEQDFKIAMKKRLEKQTTPEKKLVVVATSGGGIQASGWTAQVLAGLQDETSGIGEDFTTSIGLISSVSGGSVGTMFYLDYLDELKQNQLLNPLKSPDVLENSEKAMVQREKEKILKNAKDKMIQNATEDWLDSVGWGLAFPDLWRLFGLPIASLFGEDGKYLDRGYSLEKDWQRSLSKPTATLDDWYKQAINGDIPIPVFNSTIVENGRRFLISPMKFLPGQMADYIKLSEGEESNSEEQKKIEQSKALDFRTLYACGKYSKPCNLEVTTAARLSASFPYVSPMARNLPDNEIQDKDGKPFFQNYHMADGGYFDNAGAFTAIEWLDRFLEKNSDQLKIKTVVLLQINAFPDVELKPRQQGNKGFFTVFTGPFDALNGVRDSTQVARNIHTIQLLKDKWEYRDKDKDKKEDEKIMMQYFAISFPKKYNQPLSWRLTQDQKDNLREAWEQDKPIRNTVKCMNEFWKKRKMDSPECKQFF